MKIKKSEAYRIAQHAVLQICPVDTEVQREAVLEVLSTLHEEEKLALFTEKRKAEEAEAVKEDKNETL